MTNVVVESKTSWSIDEEQVSLQSIGELCGVQVQQLTQLRILEKEKLPMLFYYNIRTDDEGGDPVTLEKHVWINHFATLVTFQPIESLEMDPFAEIELSEKDMEWIYIHI